MLFKGEMGKDRELTADWGTKTVHFWSDSATFSSIEKQTFRIR
jgi:hypothetical protein